MAGTAPWFAMTQGDSLFGIMVNSCGGHGRLGYAYQNTRFEPEKSNHNK